MVGGRLLVAVALLVGLAACGEEQSPMEPAPDDPTEEPPAATRLVFDQQPTDGAAGVPLTPAVTVAFTDDQGAVIASATGAITVGLADNPTAASLLGTLTVNAVDGVATFDDLAVDSVGVGYTLTATSGDFTSAASTTFDVVPGAPALLAFRTQPSDADLELAIAPAVEVIVRDAFGNVATNATLDVALRLDANAGTAALLGATTVAALDGVAAFADLSVDVPASGYTLRAESGDLEPVTSAPFDVVFAIQQATTGERHACGLTTGGAAYCWGDNDVGQLGTGTAGGVSDTPVRVEGGRTFAVLAAGAFHTCGVSTGGDAYCWGSDVDGQLGDDGGFTDQSTPVPVQGGHTFATVTASFEHSCGVTTEAVGYCWGGNGFGQLGDENGLPNQPTPVPVQGGLAFVTLTAGNEHTCGITTDGDAYCWGGNEQGRLGDGTNDDQLAPVAVVGGYTFATLTAGGAHTCGVTVDAIALCWGANSFGEVGDGNGGTDSQVPAPVRGDDVAAMLAAGLHHTCGIRLDGVAGCWGRNDAGQLGDGNPGADSDTPVLVLDNHSFAGIAAGSAFSCGVTTAHMAYCWGGNERGELGDGNAGVDQSAPVSVANPGTR